MFRLRPYMLSLASVALIGCLVPSAHAWDLFGCHNACDTTVKVPAQRVLVETTAPRVTVQESTRVSRSALPQVIGTVYMPLVFPVTGVGDNRSLDSTRDADFNPLRTAHEAELYQLQHEKSRAALKAEIDAKQRVLTRMTPLSPDTNTTSCGDLDKKIGELSSRIDKIGERLTNLEKLVLIHDNYLKEKTQQTPETAPPPKKQ